MNTLYKKIKTTPLLLLLLCFEAFNLFPNKILASDYINLLQIPTITLSSLNNTLTLKWAPTNGRNVMVVAMENANTAIPANEISYLANPSFGLGSACGGGFVVYSGTGNNVTLTSLKEGATYHFAIYERNANGGYNDVTSQLLNSSQAGIESTAKINAPLLLTVVCPAIAGITCTLTGPSSSSYLGAPAGCNAGSFAGTNPWDGGSGTGYVSWAFSSPITSTTLKSGSVNTNDFATNVTTGGAGGAITISNLVCLSSLVGATIGVFTGVCCGDVSWKVASAGSFTLLTLNNTGGQSGWIAECPSTITPVALPIELSSFTGNCNESDVVDLKWKTASEINNSYFTIERSTSTDTWQEVGKIRGAGNSYSELNYSFTDNRPTNERVYYRLKQTDFQEQYKYSELITIDNCSLKNINNVRVFPSIASTELMITTFSKDCNVEIQNMFGLKVASYLLFEGENKLDVSELTGGIYFLKILNEKGIFKMTKIIISN